VTAQTTVMAAEEALMPCDFYSNNCFVSAGLTEEAGESLLDKEIDLIRRIMLKGSQRKTSARKRSSRGSSKRKTAEDCESAASGAKQHKVWRPGEEEQTKTAANGNLQHKVWDPGIHRFQAHDQEIMINFKVGRMMQEHQDPLHM